MSSENGEVYIMQDDEDEEWVSPTPAHDAVVAAITEATDVEAEAVEELDAYLDPADLESLLDGDRSEPLTFTVEGHEVTIDGDGEIEVD
jgi:hypothetical protein